MFVQKKKEIQQDVNRIVEEVGDNKIELREFDERSDFTVKEISEEFGSLKKASAELGVEIEYPESALER